MLGAYLKRQWKLLLMLGLFSAVFAAVFSLYNLPAEAVGYAAALCLAIGAVLFAVGYGGYLRRHRTLSALERNAEDTIPALPPAATALEADYQALVRAVCLSRDRSAVAAENRRREEEDYFTLWAHQIKTPIAAMDLLLQSEETPDRTALAAELLKIDQYAEMVLTYLRLGGDTTDYVLRAYALDDIVRSCARKFAKLFILRKISLQFDETRRLLLTDEKWLGFVLGQVVSNALKYTAPGGLIRIYGDGETLVVSDNGMGISPEDLPRIFEKGFTGYNGREDRKSTGIGLYLCRRVLRQLGGDIMVSSRPGQGTLVRLLLPSGERVSE